jgi:hypothetical protein
LVKTLPVTHPHTFESTLQLDTLRVRTEDGVLHVRAEGTVARDKVEGLPARLDLFRQELTEKVGEPVFFELEAIAVDIVSIRSAPDLEQMKQVPDRKLDPGTGKEVAPDKQ